VRHRAKFREGPEIWPIFTIFQDGGRRHLGFWKFQIFNGCDAQEGRTASVCQILSKSLKPRLRYGNFSIIQDGGRPPSWIFKWEISTSVPVRRPNMRHHAIFREHRSNRSRDMADFRFVSRWRPLSSWILKISNFNGWDAQEG